jgi:hypothetical protein
MYAWRDGERARDLHANKRNYAIIAKIFIASSQSISASISPRFLLSDCLCINFSILLIHRALPLGLREPLCCSTYRILENTEALFANPETELIAEQLRKIRMIIGIALFGVHVRHAGCITTQGLPFYHAFIHKKYLYT